LFVTLTFRILLKALTNLIYRDKSDYRSGAFSRSAWRKLLHNRLSAIALAYILGCTLIALLGYLITPDPTPMANRQILELSTRKPGFRIDMLKISNELEVPQQGFLKTMLYGKRTGYKYIPLTEYHYRNDTLFTVEYTGAEAEGRSNFYSPAIKPDQFISGRFWLGTDQFGRDILSRLMIGTRVSLAVGLISVMISLIVGIFIGSLGGFFRGWMDRFVVWLINVVWSIPTLLLVIAITFALGKGFWQIFVAVGLTMWVEVARVTRGQILALREKEFVEAARVLGFSNLRIIFYHILPNIAGPLIVISAANFASAILMEAGLSFLGIGVQPPMPSWGGMIRENYSYLILDAAYLAILPGLAIMALVLSFMILGNGLRDALDVKISGPAAK
jgi:peptide/nickel transport system permease protein